MITDTHKRIASELKSFFKGKGMSQMDIAKRLGVSYQVVSALLTGRTPFGKRTAKKWSDLFGLEYIWLLTGQGPMIKEECLSDIDKKSLKFSHQYVNLNQPENIEYMQQELLRALERRDKQLDEMLEQNRRLISIMETITHTPIEQSDVG